MKQKNPLYVVKGKTVLEAKGVFDMLLKKFNLEHVMKIIMNVITLLLEQVNSYSTLMAVKKIIDDLVSKMNRVLSKFHLA